jgi:hypothetical protein
MPTRSSFPVFRLLSRSVPAIGAFLAVMAFPLGGIAADEDKATPKPTERIRQLQDEAGSLRKQAEADYQVAETACYKRFFVNSCIDNAKSERLAVIRRSRELETEAHQIDLAERQRKAGEMAKKAEEHGNGPMDASSPSDDADVASPRSETATPARRVVRRNTADNSTRERAKAARRAEAAQRDRERYDARIREIEEKRARNEEGR